MSSVPTSPLRATISTADHGPVRVVTIDRPAVRNAVDGPTALALDAAMAEADDDPDVEAIVLTGAGGTFCAGADLHALASGDVDRANRVERSHRAPMGPTRRRMATPTIAAVEGYAVAGGLELAVWCDLRVVGESAVLGVFCRRWGVPLIDGGTVRLTRLLGESRAMDLVLTGRPVTATEALQIGLANRVCPDGEALATGVALAREITAHPRTTMLADRAGVRAAFDLDLDAALLAEHDRGMAAVLAGGMEQGLARFAAGAGRGGRFDDPTHDPSAPGEP
jgi:enoyl-CoA hydratase